MGREVGGGDGGIGVGTGLSERCGLSVEVSFDVSALGTEKITPRIISGLSRTSLIFRKSIGGILVLFSAGFLSTSLVKGVFSSEAVSAGGLGTIGEAVKVFLSGKISASRTLAGGGGRTCLWVAAGVSLAGLGIIGAKGGLFDCCTFAFGAGAGAGTAGFFSSTIGGTREGSGFTDDSSFSILGSSFSSSSLISAESLAKEGFAPPRFPSESGSAGVFFCPLPPFSFPLFLFFWVF